MADSTSKVVLGMALSLDGFINDKDGSVAPLYPDFAELMNASATQNAIKTTGAVVMGRRSYDMANGDYSGYEFQTPIFVVTHDVPAQAAKGQNEHLSFTFVTDGVASAIGQAKVAANGKDVTVIGGANIAQQLIRAGLIDVLQITLTPVLLGEGLRFFDNLGARQTEFEIFDVERTPNYITLSMSPKK